MKTLFNTFFLTFLFLFVFNALLAQEQTTEDVVPIPEIDVVGSTYLGIGLGLDYGGFGIKFEYIPVKHFALFGGAGYNLASISGNAGVAYKILPDKKLCPNILMMYGYNGVFKGEDSYAAKYDMTSYGFTLGVSLDILSVGKGNKFTVALLVPFRSKKFMDNYDAAKNDSNLEIKQALLPVAFSLGYNFKL